MQIKEERNWYWDNVRLMCMRHDYYTRGTCKEYEKMLDFVRDNLPTKENVYKVAKDIVEHSAEERYISNVMFDLMREVVTFSYTVNGEVEF